MPDTTPTPTAGAEFARHLRGIITVCNAHSADGYGPGSGPALMREVLDALPPDFDGAGIHGLGRFLRALAMFHRDRDAPYVRDVLDGTLERRMSEG